MGFTTFLAQHEPLADSVDMAMSSNGARITIKGELSAKHKGSYRLRLKLAGWTNSTEEYEVDLVPDKPEGRGFVQSFIYQRTILLTRVPQP